MNPLSILGLESPVWAPSDLNRHVRQLLESDYRLGDLWLAGEVSNVSQPTSGHLYFSVRDAEAAVRCVMWRPDVDRLERIPADGERVEVHGRVSVYEAGGQYQLYADRLRYAGEGELYRKFLELKARLEAEGLFDEARKRPLPEWPRTVGVVTSPTGAALRDVLTVLERRYPLLEVILSPTPVQGAAAPERIAAALHAVNEQAEPDIVLLVRGGGSLEDLWAFNSEQVVRAVAESSAPVVTGLGHETDVLLSDFAADRRAATPSAAAEVASPDRVELEAELSALQLRMARAMEERRRELAAAVGAQAERLSAFSPRARVANAIQRVDDHRRRLEAVMRARLELRQAALEGLTGTLAAVGPETVLARGYAVVRRSDDGRVVRSIAQVVSGDALSVRVSDGTFGVRAE